MSYAPPPLRRHVGSWIIRERATGATICEIFRDDPRISALNAERYEAVPADVHLASPDARAHLQGSRRAELPHLRMVGSWPPHSRGVGMRRYRVTIQMEDRPDPLPLFVSAKSKVAALDYLRASILCGKPAEVLEIVRRPQMSAGRVVRP